MTQTQIVSPEELPLDKTISLVKSCKTCKHQDGASFVMPCSSCSVCGGFNGWECMEEEL